MRSIKDIRERITSVDELVVGNWYILYDGDDEKRLLFKFRTCSGNGYVYDSFCYIYFRDRYVNGNGITFVFDGEYKYCVMAGVDEVRKYFGEVLL